jgi:hypothetical protein
VKRSETTMHQIAEARATRRVDHVAAELGVSQRTVYRMWHAMEAPPGAEEAAIFEPFPKPWTTEQRNRYHYFRLRKQSGFIFEHWNLAMSMDAMTREAFLDFAADAALYVHRRSMGHYQGAITARQPRLAVLADDQQTWNRHAAVLPMNDKTGKPYSEHSATYKAFAEEAAQKTPVHPEDRERWESVRQQLCTHDQCREILSSMRVVEHMGLVGDVPCMAVTLHCEQRREILEVEEIDRMEQLPALVYHFRRLGWAMGMASLVLGPENTPNQHVAIVERNEPRRVALVTMDEKRLLANRERARKILHDFSTRQRNGDWSSVWQRKLFFSNIFYSSGPS